jgi:radical SAM superfamily enzyme YgiQ (UPF0313 family)
MKKIGIITLTRQNTLAYASLKRIVENLGYSPICGEAIGTDCIFLSLEELTLVGHDFLGDFFQKARLSEASAILVSAPYSVSWFILPKVIRCLRQITKAPVIIGGNEPSNNHKNLMLYRFSAFGNQVTDVAPDFIVRGAAEISLPSLLRLLDKDTLHKRWDKTLMLALLDVPNLVFWTPGRKAIISTPLSSRQLTGKEIFSYVKYGEKSLALSLQRACVWAKKSGGGCLFCAIASQFGSDFHCAVQGDFFVEELANFLKDNRDIEFIDLWDDTLNISEAWVSKICDALQSLSSRVGRNLTFSCFLRPTGLTENLISKLKETNFRVAFVGADALTDALSRRLRRGCTVSELNRSLELLGRARIQPRLSVQVFSPEATLDDVGITATTALSCIKGEQSTAHVHLYTFPLFGSEIFNLLSARNNLKEIPTPLLMSKNNEGFSPYSLAYDYVSYDPDVEQLRREAYEKLGGMTSFYVRTYPGENVDARKLAEVLKAIRKGCIDSKKTHRLKSFWFLLIFALEGKEGTLSKGDLLDFLTRNEPASQIPANLRSHYGDFGYRYTLGRSLGEVMCNMKNYGQVIEMDIENYRITAEGFDSLESELEEHPEERLSVAAYGEFGKTELLKKLTDMRVRSFG